MQAFFLEIGRKLPGVFRPDDYDGNITGDKFSVVLTQLRHMPLAEWSGKGAIEHQQHNFLALQVRQGKVLPGEVGQGEIGC